MRSLLACAALLAILAAPAHASSSEATKLSGIIEAIGIVGSGLGDGSLTKVEAGTKLAALRETVGDVASYSDECRPVAYFVWQMTDSLSQGLLLADTDKPTSQMYLLVGVAELDFTHGPTFAAPMSYCGATA